MKITLSNRILSRIGMTNYTKLAVPGRGVCRYSTFQVTGMIKGFLGFEIFNSRIFWGIQKKKICGSARVSLVLRITYNQLFV